MIRGMITLSILRRATARSARELNALMEQMSRSKHSARRMTAAGLRAVLADPDIIVFVIKDAERIIATGTLLIMHTLIGVRARLEDVVVDTAYRGRGLGRKISRALIAEAKRRKATSVEFTSRPSRNAAVSMYEKLGFRKHDTNVYRLGIRG